MSQKKKLLLGPLPDQDIDYSQYEETVTHWDRIIGVLVLVAIVLAVLIYALASDDEALPSEQEKALAEIQAAPIASSDLPEDAVSLDDAKNTNTSAADKVTTIEYAPVTSQKQKPEPVTPENQASSDEPISIVEKQETPIASSSTIEPAYNESERVTSKLANVNLVNKAISRAVLTQKINNKEPGLPLPYELRLPEEGIVKVNLFTQMNGLRGKKLFHEWYRNGERQARVIIPVNVDPQRSHSSKYINLQMTGDWQVKVLDAASNIYVLADFRVVKP